MHAQHTTIYYILIRTVFQIRCLHAQQLQEYCYLHVNQHILISQRRTRLEVKASCDPSCLDLFRQNSRPIQSNECASLSRSLALFLARSASQVDGHTCCPSRAQKQKMRTRGNGQLSLATRASKISHVSQSAANAEKRFQNPSRSRIFIKLSITRERSTYSTALNAVNAHCKYDLILIKENCCSRQQCHT